MTNRLWIAVPALLIFLLASCAAHPDLSTRSPLPLAKASENDVTVNLTLELDSAGQVWLAATFTPENGWHLYSKDLPRDGLNGMGRPTLLELVPRSQLEVAGALTESVESGQADGPEGLLIYPAGPVTLRLPVILPEGSGWFDEQISITYMSCTANLCRPPVIGKLVSVRVPGAAELHP